jgi:hypothetical protein
MLLLSLIQGAISGDLHILMGLLPQASEDYGQAL